MSIVNYKKPGRNLVSADWQAFLCDLRHAANTTISEDFTARHQGAQLRNETCIKAKWDTYYNDERLKDKMFDVNQRIFELQKVLKGAEDEINLRLLDEKLFTEKKLADLIELPLKVVMECLSARESRRGQGWVIDDTEKELNKELALIEKHKAVLLDKCSKAWEQINRLEDIQFKLDLDLSNKNAAVEIDKANMSMDKKSSAISYKPNALESSSCIPAEIWLQRTESLKLTSASEVDSSIKLRSDMYNARQKADNELKAQQDRTDFILRCCIQDLLRTETRLVDCRNKLLDEQTKMSLELSTLEQALADKDAGQKLAETRLTSEVSYPAPEIVCHESRAGLMDEVMSVMAIRKQLQDHIDHCMFMYDEVTENLYRIDDELYHTHNNLDINRKCVKLREKLYEDRNVKMREFQNRKAVEC